MNPLLSRRLSSPWGGGWRAWHQDRGLGAWMETTFRGAAAVAALGLALGAADAAGAAAAEAATGPVESEINRWPFTVARAAGHAENLHAWNGGGPFLFAEPASDPAGHTARGFRPFWVQFDNAAAELRTGHLLYPLFSYAQDETTYRWSLFELVRRQGRRAGAPPPASDFDPRAKFEIFPFWFEREFADPGLNYRALFPIHGTIRQKLWLERASWTLFPLWVESERKGAVTTYLPWPFLRTTRGAARGWGFWPFFSTVERPGVSRETYYLWPLAYRLSREPTPDDPPGAPARREAGFLPFYTRSTGPGLVSEDYLWPFFGYTERTLPRRYQERRYLWPFLVQGRGDDRTLNRWAPFYTHSIVQGYDKQWFAWPLLRFAQWTDEGVERTRSQVLFFLYWQEQQRAAGRPDAPAAELSHLWPLYSSWENGAGRRQWQLFSPLEVFFPGNTAVRQAWSPLFAVARHNQEAPGETRTSLLWNAVTWETSRAEDRREFHLGPLLGITRAGTKRRVALGNGLFGFERPAAGGWKMFWWDFPSRRRQPAAGPAPALPRAANQPKTNAGPARPDPPGTPPPPRPFS